MEKAEVTWYQRTRELDQEKDKLYREMIHNAAENSRLRAIVLKEIDEKLRLTGNFNVRGALERIVYQAKQERKIPDPGGVQKGFNVLAATDVSEIIPQKVADERGLVHDHVWERAKHLYDEVSKHAHGNDKMITVRAKDFIPAECAALVTYLTMQYEWETHLDWIEEKLIK